MQEKAKRIANHPWKSLEALENQLSIKVHKFNLNVHNVKILQTIFCSALPTFLSRPIKNNKPTALKSTM